MIVIVRDAVMPDCCNTCVCSEGYGCGITGTIMTTKEMESRPDWCPLEEVEPCEDTISRKAAIDALHMHLMYRMGTDSNKKRLDEWINNLPPAQPDIIRCRNCKFASGDSRICMQFGHSPIGELDFCAWAERRTDE